MFMRQPAPSQIPKQSVSLALWGKLFDAKPRRALQCFDLPLAQPDLDTRHSGALLQVCFSLTDSFAIVTCVQDLAG